MDAIWGDKFPKWAQSQMRNAWLFLEQLHIFWFRTAVYLVRFSCQIVQSYSLKEWNTTIRYNMYNLWGAQRQQSTALESARWLSPAKCRVMSSFRSFQSLRPRQWDLPTSGRLPWAFILIDFYRFLQIWLYQLYCCTMLHPVSHASLYLKAAKPGQLVFRI